MEIDTHTLSDEPDSDRRSVKEVLTHSQLLDRYYNEGTCTSEGVFTIHCVINKPQQYSCGSKVFTDFPVASGCLGFLCPG